jgi:hypothetical protein
MESPLGHSDLETTIVYPQDVSHETRLPQAPVDHNAGTSAVYEARVISSRRSKMSNSTSSSSIMATSNLQPLPENLEDAEVAQHEEEEMQGLPRTISMSAMRGR